MASASDRAPTARRIQICLFLIELLLAASMTMAAYIGMSLLPFGTSSWVLRIFSTLVGLWIAKSTLWTLQSLKNRSVYEGNNDKAQEDLECGEENDCLKSFQSMHESRAKADHDRHNAINQKHVRFEGEEKNQDTTDLPASKEITATKAFLKGMADEEEYASKMSFPLLAVLISFLLQFAVRLLVIVQNIRRYLPWRRRNGKFSNIPFTIGRSMSFSGCSFHIFSFLNGWRGPEANTDNSMVLKAVSFDRISIKSSHIIVSPARKHPSARSPLSWLGIRFEEIDVSLTILLKRKGRSSMATKKNNCIKSLTIRLQMKALEIGIFPFTLDWCKGTGTKLDVTATFNAPDCGNHPNMSGFGMSLTSDQLSFHRFTCLSPPEGGSVSPQERVISWDKIQCSAHLIRRNEFPSHNNGRQSRREMVSSLTFPSGFVALHESKAAAKATEESARSKESPISPLARRARIHCGNQIALGVHLNDMQIFLESVEVLVHNVLSATMSHTTKTNTAAINKAKKKSSLEVVELSAAMSIHFFTLLSIAEGNRDAAPLTYFSFEVPHSSLCWEAKARAKANSGINNGQRNDILHLVANAKGVGLRYGTFYAGGLDDSSNTTSDLFRLEGMRLMLSSDQDNRDIQSNCAVVDLSGVFARADGQAMNKLAFIKKMSEDTKSLVTNLHHSAKAVNQPLSSKTNQHLRNDSNATAQNTKQDTKLSRIKISCDSVDAIVELLGEDIKGRDKIRVAFLQQGALVTIFRDEGLDQESIGSANSDVQLPGALFNSQIRRCGQHYLIEAKVSQAEGSVTFFPHSSLPVVEKASQNATDDTPGDEEISLYAQASKLIFKSAAPLNVAQTNSTASSIFTSKAIFATFDELKIYERFGNKSIDGPSLSSIPVYEFPFRSDFTFAQYRGWPIAQTYALHTAADLVQILQCKGHFCLVEERTETGERIESISIQFVRGPAELAWSPIFQWLQISCSKRVQSALAHLKTLASSRAPKKRVFSSHKTRVQIVVDPNATANIYAYFGVKTKAHAIIEGGSTMTISISKYPSSSNATTLKQFVKPDISFRANHMKLFLNGIPSPIFTFIGMSFHNYLRRADDGEIEEYSSKKENPTDVISNEVVTDHDGQPMKEIFELNLGSTSTRFPPALHFGKCIEDFVLMPKALAAGLNSMKAEPTNPVKKYQLMSIKCIIPFLDISLMDNDSDDAHSIQALPKRTILRDQFRICFEDANVGIERNVPRDWTQSQINTLDEDHSTSHVYGPVIQGGLISLTVKHVVCTIHPLNLATPMVRIDDFAINGYLNLAGLSPTTPGIQEGRTVTSTLFCHHNHLMSSNISALRHGQCCCCYGVSLHSAGIPVKLYADGQVTCGGLDISYGAVMGQSMPRFLECLKRVLPPPPESPQQGITEPLSWWDNVRFFVHGSISISADQLSFRWLLDSHTFRDQSILFTCENCEIKHTVGTFEIDASDINISIPGIPYDMSVHPSARDMKTTFLPSHKVESAVSQARHPLLHVPSLKTHIKFCWEMLHPEGVSSEHHSVYMKCKTKAKNATENDKFALHRSDGTHIVFDFELLGGDEIDNWVALRMDVLPWFTHLNSSVTFPLHLKEKKEPFPKFKSVGMKANVKELKLVTWFEDNEDNDGLCLIVKSVNYCATTDGSKDIVIEGPVKAALLDVSDFKHAGDAVGDDQQQDELMALEQMATEFGNAQYFSEATECLSQAELLPDEGGRPSPFLQLQHLSGNIKELDYIVVTGQIDVRNQSLARILAESEEDFAKSSGRSVERNESQVFEVDRTTWSILVARCRLLWTIEIRDSIMSISKDLIYTIGFMKSQIRQLQLLSGTQKDPVARESLEFSPTSLAGGGVELSLRNPAENERALHSSMIGYLLQESFEADLASADNASPDERERKEEYPTLPTLDIHFSNPQVQLHSVATGGSIILAMESAHIEGRKFVHFFVPNSQGKAAKISTSDLLRKTEHTYTLTNMEAYFLSTSVDINNGLPWLEVCTPGAGDPDNQPASLALEERFGIKNNDECSMGNNEVRDAATENVEDQHESEERDDSNSFHQYIYPSYLRHHEPLAFTKSGLLRPILDQFTFQSTQLFHRPPIHYSKEELVYFIQHGLVVVQEEAAVDNIGLQIDLLNFNLDSYQFKTTLDVIRNVLLEPPKPHQRHQSFDQDEADAASKSPGKISSVAATDMEEVLRNIDPKHRGKKSRQMLRTAAMSLLRDVEDRIALNGEEVFRRISYSLCKLQWYIQSEDSIDDVQIAFTGFNGQHDYSRDGYISSQFSLEDVHVSSSRPGPDSIGFMDPTSVVYSVLGNERSPCQRCDQHFDHSKNDLNSCVFHLGQFTCGVWTCCNSNNASAPGCKSGPHTGKERAALVRVESLPRIVEGISLFSHFEVNIFPGIPSTLAVQISKSMSRLFMSYFFHGNEEEDDTDAVSMSSDVTGTTDSISIPSEYSPKPPVRKKSLLIGSGKGSPGPGNQRSESTGESSEFDSTSEIGLTKDESEIVFIKVWRVGYVDVNVSLGGFKRLPIQSLEISVPAYSKAYELGSWEYLGRKYLSYLIREVLKSGASSGLDKFRRKVMGSTPSLSPAQRGDQLLEPSILEPTSPRSLPPSLPPILDSGPAELDNFIGRHLRRPMGAADILGTPAKKSVKKKKKITFKHR